MFYTARHPTFDAFKRSSHLIPMAMYVLLFPFYRMETSSIWYSPVVCEALREAHFLTLFTHNNYITKKVWISSLRCINFSFISFKK